MKELNIDYEPNEMCVDCVINHRIKKGLSFKINCKPLEKDYFDKEVTQNNVFELQATSAYYFTKYILGIEPRKFQAEMIQCTQNRKQLRIQRRAGKSHALAMYMIWYQMQHPQQRIRVVAPREIHVLELFDKMNEMIVNQPMVFNSVIKTGKSSVLYRKNPFEFKFKNLSTIRGITTGDKEGTSVRSQSADLLVMDEQDYVPDEAIAAVFPLIASQENTEFMVSSTPSGQRSYFYNWCNDPGYKELHKSFQEVEIYSPEKDEEFKRTFSKEKYEREVLAIFTMQDSSVFQNDLIDKQLEDYDYITPDNVIPGVYTIGVDWNESAAGVHIVVARYESDTGKYRIQNVEIVNPSEFTQLVAIDKIIHLYEQYKPKKVVVDEGYGITQIQQLKKWGMENPQSGFLDQLTIIPFGQKMEIRDPITGQLMDTYTKPFLVQITQRMLEAGSLILPAREDYRQKLIGQMRSYEIVHMSENGAPKFTKGEVHTLEQMMLQLYGMWSIQLDLMKSYSPSVQDQQNRNIQKDGIQPKQSKIRKHTLENGFMNQNVIRRYLNKDWRQQWYRLNK